MKHRFLKMASFATCLTALTLLFAVCVARPALAGTWSVVISSPSYTRLVNGVNFGPTTTFSTTPGTNGVSLPTINGGASGTPTNPGSISVSLNATITGTWVPNPSIPNELPPVGQSVKVSTAATSYGIHTSSSTPSLAASDGQSDTVVDFTYDGNPEETSSGVHLIPVSGTTFTVNINMTASASGGGADTASVGAGISMDLRSVTIGTNLPQTNTKPTTMPTGGWTTAIPVANPLTGNPVYVDTIGPVPAPQVTIGYSASETGAWANNSSYLWNFSISGYSTNGLFNPTAILGVTNEYTYPTVNTGTQEHAYIHVTDATDGANATGNLDVRFHNQWEDFTPDVNNLTTQETYIIPGVGVQNNGTTPITPSFTQTISGTVNFQAALNGGFTLTDLGTLGITFTPSISVSSSGATTVPGPTIQPGYYSTPDLYCYYKRDNCQVDEYGTSGYLATYEESFDNPSPMTLVIGWTAVAKIP